MQTSSPDEHIRCLRVVAEEPAPEYVPDNEALAAIADHIDEWVARLDPRSEVRGALVRVRNTARNLGIRGALEPVARDGRAQRPGAQR